MRHNPALLATDAPPIPEARRWLDGLTFPPDQPLLQHLHPAGVAARHANDEAQV